MKPVHALAAALLSGLALSACSEPPAPPAPPPPAAPPAASSAEKGFIGRKVEQALAKAHEEMRTQSIGIGPDGIDININGRRIRSGDNANLPKAEITPQGDLLIEAKPVAIDAVQRQQLLAYREQIIGIAGAGMAIGAQGADLAGKAVTGVVGAIFSGDAGGKAFEQKMDAEGKKIEAEALKLCAMLPPLLASQEQLSASLPAFKPYASMTQSDIDECGQNGEHAGISIGSN
ncbi:MAG: hypothetical protein V4704_05775 [Pseudomonadota bacterium]